MRNEEKNFFDLEIRDQGQSCGRFFARAHIYPPNRIESIRLLLPPCCLAVRETSLRFEPRAQLKSRWAAVARKSANLVQISKDTSGRCPRWPPIPSLSLSLTLFKYLVKPFDSYRLSMIAIFFRRCKAGYELYILTDCVCHSLLLHACSQSEIFPTETTNFSRFSQDFELRVLSIVSSTHEPKQTKLLVARDSKISLFEIVISSQFLSIFKIKSIINSLLVGNFYPATS